MNELDQDQIAILDKFYLTLSNTLVKNNERINKNSILFSMWKFSSSKKSKYLADSSVNPNIFKDQICLNNLIEEGYLGRVNSQIEFDECVITAKGIWLLDSIKNKKSEIDLLDFINGAEYSFSTTQVRLSPKEKTILMVLIGLRFFSKNMVMNLEVNNESDEKLARWIDIFSETKTFCLEQDLFKKDYSFEPRGIEDPIQHLFTHTNELSKRTHHLYQFQRGRKYYLDIIEEEKESTPQQIISKLQFLFKMIFESNVLPTDKLRAVNNFLLHLSHEKGIYVLDDLKFINYSWDEIICNSLLEL